MLCQVQLDHHFQMRVVNLDTKSILRCLNENTLLPEDYTVKSHKLQKRAADNKHLFYRKAIFMYISENIYRHIRQMDWGIPGAVCIFSLVGCVSQS